MNQITLQLVVAVTLLLVVRSIGGDEPTNPVTPEELRRLVS